MENGDVALKLTNFLLLAKRERRNQQEESTGESRKRHRISCEKGGQSDGRARRAGRFARLSGLRTRKVRRPPLKFYCASEKCTRRFFCQQSSLDSVHCGRSLP
jgi:hypothetical protein